MRLFGSFETFGSFGSFRPFGSFGVFSTVLVSLALTGGVKAQTPTLELRARSVNVATPGASASIRLFRWSNDAERAPLLNALAPPAPAPAPAAAAPGAAPAAAAGRGGRGGRGRGGAAAAPLSPTARLTAAITAAPTIGYIWTDGVTGYSIKYAWRAPRAGGGERIVLATDRRLGAHSPAWTPASGTPTDYGFTVIEMQLDAAGAGEARTSLTTAVAADESARTLTLEGYSAAPVLLKVTR